MGILHSSLLPHSPKLPTMKISFVNLNIKRGIFEEEPFLFSYPLYACMYNYAILLGPKMAYAELFIAVISTWAILTITQILDQQK